MFSAIFSFEVRQQFRKPFTWIFLLLMFAQGIYYMRHSGEFFSADQTYANAPVVMYTVLAGIGYISFIVTALLGGASLTKDLEYRTSSLLYTTRADQFSFFWGRYAGSAFILLLLNLAYLAGIVLYSFLPVPNLGPLSLSALAKGILLILLPNTFVLYTFCFAVASLTRSGKSAYLVVLFAMLFMIFGVSLHDMGIHHPLSILGDPTAFTVLLTQLEHLSPAEKNAYSPDFKGLLLYNRIIWVAIGVIVLIIARIKYSFKNFIAHAERKTKKKLDDAASYTAPVFHEQALRSTTRSFSTGSHWKKVGSLAWLEFKTVTRPTGFRIFLVILLIFYVCYIALWQQQYYSAAPTLPVTVEVTGVTLALSFYFLMFIIINTGELLFKNQSSGFWTIADALPLPSWVTVLSKVFAMTGIALLLSAFLMVLGITVQSVKGYYNFQPGIYLNELFIRWTPKYIVYILLTTFIAGITASRYTTHGIAVIFLVISIVLHELDVIEQNRFNFMFSPGSGMNTDMNGNGIFTTAHAWYMLYWLSLSLALLAIALWVWQRGIPKSLFARMRKQQKLHPVLLLLFLGGMTSFVLCGNKIYRTVNIQNRFETNEEERMSSVLYEKKYKWLENAPQPLIQHIALDLDLYPEKRALEYRTVLSLKNQSESGIDTLHIEWMDFSEIHSLSASGSKLTLLNKDGEMRHSQYLLEQPLQPGDSLILSVEGSMKYEGFTNDDPQKELTFNGSFLPLDIIPFMGYDERRELKENRYREIYGLPKLAARLPDTTDPFASRRLFASAQANRISYTFNISTQADQRIVAPGILQKEWTENGRNHFRFVSELPGVFDFHILSARYAVKEATVNTGGNVKKISLYYHPGHPYNAEHFMASAKEALLFLESILGPYPYQQVCIAERPRYDEDLFAYENVMVLPENHGWIADIRRQEDLDYLRYITAKLMAEQYMRRSDISRTQGYPVITKSIPGYLALLQLAHFYGEASLKDHLIKNHEDYLKGRGSEKNEEPVLIKVDDEADYVSEKKGAYILYRLAQMAGAEKVNGAIAGFLEEAMHSPQQPVNAGLFYEKLKAAAGDEHNAFLQSAFETRSVYQPDKK